jgi:hypothetical protein
VRQDPALQAELAELERIVAGQRREIERDLLASRQGRQSRVWPGPGRIAIFSDTAARSLRFSEAESPGTMEDTGSDREREP